MAHNPATAPSPWLSEHDYGKYAVRWRLALLIGLALAQLEGSVGMCEGVGLIIRQSLGPLDAGTNETCDVCAAHPSALEHLRDRRGHPWSRD
jgi:hypothetical protein